MGVAVEMCSLKLFPNLDAALKGVFNRVLTELWLGVNNIGDAGKTAVQDVVKVPGVDLSCI